MMDYLITFRYYSDERAPSPFFISRFGLVDWNTPTKAKATGDRSCKNRNLFTFNLQQPAGTGWTGKQEK